MLLTRGKSNNSRIPRSATPAARNSSGSRMRKFVRRSQRIESPGDTAGYNESYTPPARVWARRDVTACGTAVFKECYMPQDLEGVLETETGGGTAVFKERCMPRKFVRLPSVRAENRLRRKPETARHRQGLKGATSGLEYDAPTGAGNCKSRTANQAVSLYRRRAGVTETGNCAPQTHVRIPYPTDGVVGVTKARNCAPQIATARTCVSFTGTGVPLASTRPTSTATARTCVSFTGTGVPLASTRPTSTATDRASVSFTDTAPTEAGSGRPQAVPDDCSVNRRAASLRGRIQCFITRCKSGSLAGSGWHQCAGVSNASSQNFIAIPLFQAIKMISILFHRCHTPMIFSIS